MRFSLLSLTFVLATGVSSAQVPNLGINASLNGKRVLPVDNPWNQDISAMPVDKASSALLAAVGATMRFTLGSTDGTGAPISYIVVAGDQALVNVEFGNGAESDHSLYPIPFNAPIEGGPDSTGDRHVIVVDRDNWMLYELFRGFPKAGLPDWWAVQGSIFDLNSNALRPAGWTSADAAGLPIFPGIIRWDEVWERGEINHALRVTVPVTSQGYLFPARHYASSSKNKSLPQMGLRVRLKASVDISGFPYEAQVILRALKKYGMFVADNAPKRAYWELISTKDSRWNNAALHTIQNLNSSHLEVVQRGLVEPVFESLSLASPSLTGGLSTTATVTLNGPAPPGGLTINVDSDNPATVPAVNSIFFPEGATSALFAIQTRPVAAGTNTFVRVSALEYVKQTRLSLDPITAKSMSVSPAAVLGGTSTTATVTLKAPAGPGPLTVSISSNNPAVAPISPTFVIPEGNLTGTITIQTLPVGLKTEAVLTATLNGPIVKSTVTVKVPTMASIAVSPASAKGGVDRVGTLKLNGPAPEGGMPITLTSASALVTVPLTVVVPAGSTTVTFPIQTSVVTVNTTVRVTATLGTGSIGMTVTLTK